MASQRPFRFNRLRYRETENRKRYYRKTRKLVTLKLPVVHSTGKGSVSNAFEQRHDYAARVLCCNTLLLTEQHMTFWQGNQFSFTIGQQILST